MSPFDPRDYTGTPHVAPLVPRLPIRLSRTEILTVVYRTDRSAASRLVPEPLDITSDLCIVHVYWMHDAQWFGVYGESAVQLPVRLPGGGEAVYSPFLVLGSDAAVAAGREIYGQAKKMGNVSLRPDGDLLVGQVERNGIDVITTTMCWKQSPVDTDLLGQWVPGADLNVNLRIFPNGEGQFCRQLLTRRFADVSTRESWTGPATVELRPNAQFPVHLLPVREVVLGLHRVIDLTLGVEQVAYTYE